MAYGQNPKCQQQWVFGREVPNRDVSDGQNYVNS